MAAIVAIGIALHAGFAPAQAQAPDCKGDCTITVSVSYDFVPAAGDDPLKITRFKWQVTAASTGKCQASAQSSEEDGRITIRFPGERGERVCLIRLGDNDSFTRNAERCGGTTAGFPNPSESFEKDLAPQSFTSIHIQGGYELTCTPAGDCSPPPPDRTGQCVTSKDFPASKDKVKFEFEFGGGKIKHDGAESQPDPAKNTKVVSWTKTIKCQGVCEGIP